MWHQWIHYADGSTIQTMKGSRSISEFALNVPTRIGKKLILLDFIQLNDGGYDVGIGSITLDKLSPYTVTKDMFVFHSEGDREIIPRIAPIFKVQAKRASSKENPSITKIINKELLLEAKAEKYAIIRGINMLSQSLQPHFSSISAITERLQACCVEHPLEKWDTDSPLAHIPIVHNIPVQSKPI